MSSIGKLTTWQEMQARTHPTVLMSLWTCVNGSNFGIDSFYCRSCDLGDLDLKLRMFGATDKGLVRALNQDAYSCDASLGIVILSDGMGGHAAGEVASHMVVEGLTESLAKISESAVDDVPVRIDEALKTVNTKLILRSQEDSSCRGMGATVNILCFTHGFVTIGHVGDSRTYLVRAFKSSDNKPRFGSWQLTIDHNLGTFLDRGILNLSGSASEGQLSARDRSKLTRGMGVMPDPKPDIYSKRLTDGDVFLTCSDGLHGFVSDRDVLRALVAGSIADAPQRLIDIAKAAGAPDNVTVVISIVSDLNEPFREFSGPIFDTRPYMLRLPNGEIQGPIVASEVIDLWIKRTLPSNTEMASGLGEWVLLRNKDLLVKAYPEFKQEIFLNHLHYETSEEISEQATKTLETLESSSHNKPTHILIWVLLLILSVGMTLTILLLPELQSVLLPAY